MPICPGQTPGIAIRAHAHTSRRSQGKVGPADLATVAGSLAAPPVAKGRDDRQAAPALGVRIRLAKLQVVWALVPYLDPKRPLGCQQAEGDRRPVWEDHGGV